MSTALQTPGPWTAQSLLNDRLGQWVVTSPGTGIGNPLVCDGIRNKQTACLIAAAPDMFEALYMVLEEGTTPEAEEVVRAAIAKVGGAS